MVYLQLYWEQEAEKMIGALLKKNKNKQFTEQIQKIYLIDKKLRDTLLKRWITRCKITHSLAFFQWRAKYEPRANIDELEEVFEDKIQKTIA